jgi:squalene-associated FAD-dependent desaturase
MTSEAARRPSVAIVGGGLAGLSAAVALSTADCQVRLFESRRRLGGRATSFREPISGELVDLCQHVSMRCCTNLADLARRTGIAGAFQSTDVLHFIGPDGCQCDLQASPWLPAPLHLGPALRRLGFLTASDRRQIARALWSLLRTRFEDGPQAPTVAAWLRSQGQSARAIEWFWGVVLVSALGESLERASIAAARKVFVDGFLISRDAYIVEVPQVPLGRLYGEQVPRWLEQRGVEILSGLAVKQVGRAAGGRLNVTAADAEPREFDRVIVAVPWHQLAGLLGAELQFDTSWLQALAAWEAVPITGVHLWFDRPITSLPHAVLVGRLGQWLFNRSVAANRGEAAEAKGAPDETGEYYYQVVISASRDLAGRDREALVSELCDELRAIWPEAAEARLLRSRVVTEQSAVFSVKPGSERLRPSQRTPIDGLFLAGDWTATLWPATMEGAVRSGYLAAEEVTASLGRRQNFLAADLPRSWLAKLLIR